MKKVFLILFLLNAIFHCFIKAQTDTVYTVYKKVIPVTALKIYSNQVAFLVLKNNLPVKYPINEIRTIIFKNSVQIKFHRSRAINALTAYYDATVNLNNGSLFTAFVDSIDQSFLYYHKHDDSTNFKTDVNTIMCLVYANGLQADFITANSLKALMAQREINKPKAVENRSNTGSFLGAMMGLSNAWIEADGSINSERSANNGIASGIILSKEFSRTSGIHFGLLYEQKGVVYSGNDTKVELKTSYITLPFTYQAFIGKSHLKGFFEGGFYLGYLLTGKNTITTPDTLIDWNILSDNFQTNRFDIGFLFGTGMKYKLYPHQFTAGIRYALGLATLNPDPLEYYPYYVSYGSPNRSFVFYVSYGIDLMGYRQQKKSSANLK